MVCKSLARQIVCINIIQRNSYLFLGSVAESYTYSGNLLAISVVLIDFICAEIIEGAEEDTFKAGALTFSE